MGYKAGVRILWNKSEYDERNLKAGGIHFLGTRRTYIIAHIHTVEPTYDGSIPRLSKFNSQ